MQESKVEFMRQRHLDFIDSLEKNKSMYSIGFYVRNHLRMGGAYWAITSLALLKQTIPEKSITDLSKWIVMCQNEDGGFGGNVGHDSGITNTLYALLVLFQLKQMDQVDLQKVEKYVESLYVPETGAFMGDVFGEVDTRFVYAGLYIYIFLDKPLPEKSFEFLSNCFNEDGGFGGQPEVESHAAYIFCGISAIALLDKTQDLPLPKIKQFLATRQTKLGGFNGRPEKLPDVCYSWWVLSSLHTVNVSILQTNPLYSEFMLDTDANPNVSNLLYIQI